MAESFKDHFSDVAGSYAEYRPAYPTELFEWLASKSPGRTRAWDCATGNGQAAVALAKLFDQVIATDASPEQIAHATPHPKVHYSVSPAEESALTEDSVDLITVAQAAHWFDLERFYVEVERVARPGGILALWCYGTIEFPDQEIHNTVDDFYRNIVGPFWPPERHWVEEGYRSLPFPFTELQAPCFAIRKQFTLDRFLGYLRTWSATQRFIQANQFDPVEKLGARLQQLWPGETVQVNWPIGLRVGTIQVPWRSTVAS